jgi:uncharacterized membrane protein
MEQPSLENLKPAIAGYIIDGKIDVKELVATIIDLAIRGYITIDYTGTDWEKIQVKSLRLVKKEGNLNGYESALLSDLFRKSDSINIRQLFSYALTFRDFKIAFDEELAENSRLNYVFQYYLRIKYDANPRKLSQKIWLYICNFFIFFFLFLGSMAPIYLMILVMETGQFIIYGLLIFGIIALCIGFTLLFIKWLSEAEEISESDKQFVGARQKYLDLYLFMKTHKLEEGRLFNEFLPYAIAFGLDTYWMKAFKLSSEYLTEYSKDVKSDYH